MFQTVIGLYTVAVNDGTRINLTVDTNACASLNTEREKWSIDYMKEVLGISIV